MTVREEIECIPDYPQFRTSDGELTSCRELLMSAVDAFEDALAVKKCGKTVSLKKLSRMSDRRLAKSR